MRLIGKKRFAPKAKKCCAPRLLADSQLMTRPWAAKTHPAQGEKTVCSAILIGWTELLESASLPRPSSRNARSNGGDKQTFDGRVSTGAHADFDRSQTSMTRVESLLHYHLHLSNVILRRPTNGRVRPLNVWVRQLACGPRMNFKTDSFKTDSMCRQVSASSV